MSHRKILGQGLSNSVSNNKSTTDGSWGLLLLELELLYYVVSCYVNSSLLTQGLSCFFMVIKVTKCVISTRLLSFHFILILVYDVIFLSSKKHLACFLIDVSLS